MNNIKKYKLFILFNLLFIGGIIQAQIPRKSNWSLSAGPDFSFYGIPNNYAFNSIKFGFNAGINLNHHISEKTNFVTGLQFIHRTFDMQLHEEGFESLRVNTQSFEIPLGVRRDFYENKKYSNFFMGASFLNNIVLGSNATKKYNDGYYTYYREVEKYVNFYNPGFKLEFGLKNESHKRRYVMITGYTKMYFLNLLTNYKQEKYNCITIGANIEYVFY